MESDLKHSGGDQDGAFPYAYANKEQHDPRQAAQAA